MNEVMKPHREITEEEVQKCLDATQWRPASTEYFRGGGFSSDFLTKGERAFLAEFNNILKQPWKAQTYRIIHKIALSFFTFSIPCRSSSYIFFKDPIKMWGAFKTT